MTLLSRISRRLRPAASAIALLAAAGAVQTGATSVARADQMPQQPAGVVVDADTGAILSAYNIDGPQPPDLAARLMTIIMAIQDVADGTLKADEELALAEGANIFAASAIRMTAEGGDIKRAPMTALVSRIGHNPQLLQERMFALSKRIGMRGSHLEIRRADDGGPVFVGGTTVRDSARLMISLLRAHGDATRTIFERTVANVPAGEVWMTERGMCLMVRVAEDAGRRLVAAVSGQSSDTACFTKAMEIIDLADSRLSEVSIARARATEDRGPSQAN